MIFIGSYIGGRIQDTRGPRMVALVGGVIYARRRAARRLRRQPRPALAAGPRLRRDRRLRPRRRLHRADRDAAEVVPRQARADHRPGGRRVRLRCGAHRPGRAVADRQGPRRPDQGVHPARHRLPGDVAGRRLVLQQPARGLRRAGLRAVAAAGRRAAAARLHPGRGAAHPAVVPAHRDPHPQRHRRHRADLAGRGERHRHRRLLDGRRRDRRSASWRSSTAAGGSSGPRPRTASAG